MAATFDKEGALDRVDGDLHLLKDLIRLCREQYHSRLPAMEGMLRVDDFASIATSAHALKGSFGNVGGEAVVMVAAQLEHAAKLGEGESVSELLASLAVEIDEFFEVACEELGG